MLRQLQLVHHLVDLLDDIVRSVVAEGELVIGASGDRCLNVRLQLHQQHVAHLKDTEGAFIFCVLLHSESSMLQMLLEEVLDDRPSTSATPIQSSSCKRLLIRLQRIYNF